jgi:hypothetical protein
MGVHKWYTRHESQRIFRYRHILCKASLDICILNRMRDLFRTMIDMMNALLSRLSSVARLSYRGFTRDKHMRSWGTEHPSLNETRGKGIPLVEVGTAGGEISSAVLVGRTRESRWDTSTTDREISLQYLRHPTPRREHCTPHHRHRLPSRYDFPLLLRLASP